MADFNSTMAAMIANARPPQAPGSSGPTVVPGPQGLINESKGVSVGAKVQIEPLMKFLGYKTPEEKEKMSQQFQETRSNFKDADWYQIIANPKVQKTLEGLYKSGIGSVTQNYQLGIYDIPKVDLASKLGKMNKEGILAGGAGLEASRNLVAGERAISALTPEGLQLKQSQILTEQMQQQNIGKNIEATQQGMTYDTNMLPLRRRQLELQNNETIANTNKYNAEMALAKREMELKAAKASPEQLEQMKAIKEANLRYQIGFNAAMRDRTLVDKAPVTPADKYESDSALISSGLEHIQTLNSYGGDAASNEASLRAVWGVAERDFFEAPLSKDKEENKQRAAYMPSLVSQGMEMFVLSGSKDLNMAYRICEAAKKVYPPEKVEQVLNGLNLDKADADKVFDMLFPKVAEEPTQPQPVKKEGFFTPIITPYPPVP